MSLKRAERLKGVDKDLVYAIEKMSEEVPFDVLIVQGLRSVEEQEKLIAQGKSWVKNVKVAPHVVGRAVDMVPLINGKDCDWKDIVKFDLMYDIMSKYIKLAPKIAKDRNHYQIVPRKKVT